MIENLNILGKFDPIQKTPFGDLRYMALKTMQDLRDKYIFDDIQKYIDKYFGFKGE